MSRKKVVEQYLMGHIYYGTVHVPMNCELLSVQKGPVLKNELVFYSLLKLFIKNLPCAKLGGIYDEKDSACIWGVNTVNWESRWVSQQLKLG